jgi:hypothetical protein
MYPFSFVTKCLILNKLLTMSSGIFCTIKLDPFLQEFLRGYYNCNSIVFKFPREDADELHLAKKFNDLFDNPPRDFKPFIFGNWEFRIEIPYQVHKDPFYFNYLSIRTMQILSKKVFDAWRDDYYDFIREKRSKGWHNYKDIVELYMEARRISPEYYDRLIKDYQRWRTIKNNKTYQQKLMRQNKTVCPA